MPSTRYSVSTSQFFLASAVPCMLQGISIHENNAASVTYYVCDVNNESAENIVMVIQSIPQSTVKLAFPMPIYFSQGLYIEAAGSIPTITLELL